MPSEKPEPERAEKPETTTIETTRLILRPWAGRDADSLFEYAKDPDVGPLTGWPAHTSVQDSRRIIDTVLTAPESYAIVIKKRPTRDEAVGCACIHIGKDAHFPIPENEGEITYWIGRPFWGNGYMPEAVVALIRHAFVDLDLKAVWCSWDEGNDRNRRVQEKAGLRSHHVIQKRKRPRMNDEATTYVNRLTKDQWLLGQQEDPTDLSDIDRQQQEGIEIAENPPLIAYIRAGGQTGADRAALDAARDRRTPICGWCPKDGLAEDMEKAPGILRDYPELVETPSVGYVQRTAWNVRDSHATLIVAPDGLEPLSGTEMTEKFAKGYGRPCFVAKDPDEVDRILEWLRGVGKGLTLNVAGPRASKVPEVYSMTKDIVTRLIDGQ